MGARLRAGAGPCAGRGGDRAGGGGEGVGAGPSSLGRWQGANGLNPTSCAVNGFLPASLHVLETLRSLSLSLSPRVRHIVCLPQSIPSLGLDFLIVIYVGHDAKV